MDFWPTAANMVCALGPGDQVIDIRTPGEYDRWHGFQGLPRDGLSCLDCLNAVNPRMLNKQTAAARPILVHSPRPDGANADDKCESVRSSARGAGWKKLLKNLIVAYLVQSGYKAEVDPATDGERIDVLTRSGNRRIAIRVELDKLNEVDFQVAREQLERQEKNTEVLWITFGCSWVDIANAVGIRFLTEPPKGGLIDVGGVFPVVDAGIFMFGLQGLTPSRPVGLGYFLDAFMAGNIQNHPIEGKRRGWARTKAWDRHIRRLVRKHADLTQQRTDLVQELKDTKRRFQEERRALELAVAAAERRAASAERDAETERERTAAVREEREQAAAHRTAATTWGTGIESLRDTSVVARLGLRRHPAFVYPPPTTASDPQTTNDWLRSLQTLRPWAIATVAIAVPLVLFIYLTATNIVSPVGNLAHRAALICLALVPAALALLVDGRWCWAFDNHSHRRGHRRQQGFLRRCGHREHSLNIFDAWLLLSALISTALVAWLITQWT